MIDSATAMMAPGTFGRNFLNPKMIARVPSANANVGHDRSGIDVIMCHCCSNQLPVPFGTPSMSGI